MRAFPKSFDRVEDDGEPACLKVRLQPRLKPRLQAGSPTLNGILRLARLAIKARRSIRLVENG
ncbi:hypothetical protein [Paraburkholderia sp. BL6669N2]|uniref:hypothetical protein n=1 Tax=Paraburkholderia sp. BL6669N2 TaxID=1938807 RepID=UPI000E24C637|nr:hypothetical protein [Paraburkholderia sp. BL6669N2]